MMAEFAVAPCLCGRTPHINKNPNETEHRYSLKCCDNEAYAPTETLCMVTWNRLIAGLKPKEEEHENSKA